ncbi:membrane associated rhomboid family serine protease [Catenulispora sp. GAS73]
MTMPPGSPGSPPVPATDLPACYRHPEREAQIRCTRCERRICPECMVPASVGFQCPDCVRGGNQQVPKARTPFGAVLRPRVVPVVTYSLIALNFVMFGLQHIVGTSQVGAAGGGVFQVNTLDMRLELIAKGTWVDGQPIGVANGEWYRLVTSMFLHANLVHIASNMISLFFIGPMLEAMLGKLRFVLVYLIGGLAGAVTSYWFMTPLSPASLGASGAISAVFGCLVVIGLRRKILDPGMIVVVLVINIVIPLQNTNIDWRDHVGGVVAGALIGAVYAFAPELIRTLGKAGAPREQQVRLLNGLGFGTMALVLALAIAATAVHTAHLNDPANRTRTVDGAPYTPGLTRVVTDVPDSYPQASGTYPHWG